MQDHSPPTLRERILLGVGGGIAAYKAADLVRRLREAGAEVRVVMTDAAREFVTPTTFQALSGHPVRCSLWDAAAEAAMGHIELARWADRIVVAPATANLVARLASGLADDLLTTLALASRAPLVLAPAMNQAMWAHPATRANIATLTDRGVVLVGPGVGSQACGDEGAGRMAEPAEIVAALASSAASDGALSGRRVLVNAGPTYEDIDPVRFIGNRSSGKMGFAVAEAAARAGAAVTLVAGPVRLPTPDRVARVDVRSAREMAEAVFRLVPEHDVFVAAAAVADFAPAAIAESKIRKTDHGMTLNLRPTTDILATIGARPNRPFLVGFAAETDSVETSARDKLARKNLDLIAANRVGGPDGAFDADDNALVLIARDGTRVDLERAPKPVIAARLVAEIAARLPAR
jgi:phosphopantothenoylcysteine decarboxylase/phosphopantothenate--cysteine ligase